ncbi:acyl-CoA N-acyltransferase [Cenococcum geophilum 1.58]|uniref:acyl-CoA N-acyltransferase n=1 Tax=Cenococcum geophilum 1.58 TaxID=794803 RepID=UPI00358DE6E1|nr:acyl-CoA N-acyltransferase [Cenococcum geophilum 1.58]
MHIRLATPRDLHRLAEITVTSLEDDPTFPYMWRYRHEYPEDNFFWWQLQLTDDLCNKKYTFLVTVTDNDDDFAQDVPTDTIVAWAIWERLGNSAAARARWARKNTWHNAFDILVIKATAWSISKRYSRRDADPARVGAFIEEEARVRATFFTPDYPEMWYMQLLVTHRDFRRHGAASRLVAWGTTEADSEGIHCGTESSPMGEPVYKSFGFREIGRMTVQVEGDQETLDFPVMLRAPRTKAARDEKMS